MATPTRNVLAIHPFLRGTALNPTAGGKNLAARECTNVLLEMGYKVYVWPLVGLGNSSTEKLVSQHDVIWSESGRVTIVPTCYPPALSRLLFEWLKQLRRSRFRISVAWRNAVTAAFCRPLNAIATVIKETRPSLIHVHQSGNPVGYQLKRISDGVRTLLTHHSAKLSPFVGSYDWIVTPSDWMRERIVAEFKDTQPRSQVIPYFLQSVYTTTAGVPDRSGVCFIGVLNGNRKGLDILLDALEILKNAGKHHHLDVVGEGDALPGYRDAAATKGLDVSFHGKLSPEGNARLLRRASLFCMPSRAENFAIVYLEALACGTPVIGYARTVAELNRYLGREVGAPFDAQFSSGPALASLIDEWLTTKCYEFERQREEIAMTVRRRYSLDSYRAEYRALYTRLVENDAARVEN